MKILGAVYSFPTNYVCLEFRQYIDGVSPDSPDGSEFLICRFNDAPTITISVLSEV
jgi:hypothetical protein